MRRLVRYPMEYGYPAQVSNHRRSIVPLDIATVRVTRQTIQHSAVFLRYEAQKAAANTAN